jgi:hypothetical protein
VIAAGHHIDPVILADGHAVGCVELTGPG